MSVPPPVAETFRETFCAQYGVPIDLYGVTVLRLTLYPHARWLAELSPREFLAPERTFVADVGALTRWRSFGGVAHAFQHTPANRRFWRRGLRLRVSVDRMRVLFSEVMGGIPSGPNESRLRDENRREPGSFVAD
jgi:hypothetical protein